MHPGGALHELPQQQRGADGAGLPPAAVLHIGYIAFDERLIFREQRQFPELFAGALPGLDEAVDQRGVVAHHTGADLAQGGDHRAGEGGDVHQAGDAALPGQAEGVGQHQPPLGVGVDDFDGLAVHRPHYVAGALRRAAGHIFGGRHHSGYIDAGAQLPDGLHRAQHRGAAGHIAFHRLHSGGGFQRNAAGVKGDALANQPQIVGRVVRVSGVVQRYQLGRFVRPLGYADEGAHAHFPHLFVAEHFQRHSRLLGYLPGGFGHSGGRQHIGRFVDQVPGQQRGPGHYAPGIHARLQCGGFIRILLGDGQGFEFGGGLAVGRAVPLKAVEAQEGALGDGLGGLGGVEAAGPGAVGDGEGAADAPAAEVAHRFGGGPAHGGGVQFVPRAQAGHQHPGRAQPSHGVQQRHFAGGALDFAVGHQLADGAAQLPVDGAGGPAGFRHALEQVDNQRRGFRRENVGDFHA